MIELTIKVPEYIADIISETSQAFYVEALKEVAGQRLCYAQKRLDDLKSEITAYESKYGKSYEEFSPDVPDTLEGHDDWTEWLYLVKVSDELSDKIEKLNFIINK